MGAPDGSSCEAVNDCSTPIAFAGNTGSTPGASKTFQPQRCGLTSISVIMMASRWLHRLVRWLAWQATASSINSINVLFELENVDLVESSFNPFFFLLFGTALAA